MAAGVLAVAHSLGIGIPDELSVAGFDDVPLASQVWPALTTIRQPISAMSAKAADLLLQQLRGEAEDRAAHVLESSVTFRQSTGPAHNQKLQQIRSVRRAKAALSASATEE
jgi:LacI family transcriptional regulator